MVASASFPVGPFDATNGSLEPLIHDVRRFYSFFWAAYDDRKWELNYRDDLPMVKRPARMSVVERDEIIVILSWPSHAINRHGHTYPRDQYPDLAKMGDVHEIAKTLNLGEVIDYQKFPLQHDRIKANREDFDEGRNERNLRATALVKDAAEKWARELAEEHISRTRPDFEEAKRRMIGAYGKLFELEHGLREFVAETLKDRHGDDWWTKASIDQRITDGVDERKNDKRGAYLDELDSSYLAYVDFPDLRAIIMDNQRIFRHVLGPREQPINWFTSALAALEPIRNRIGHVNTLSADDLHDFYRDSDRILAAVRSHGQSSSNATQGDSSPIFAGSGNTYNIGPQQSETQRTPPPLITVESSQVEKFARLRITNLGGTGTFKATAQLIENGVLVADDWPIKWRDSEATERQIFQAEPAILEIASIERSRISLLSFMDQEMTADDYEVKAAFCTPGEDLSAPSYTQIRIRVRIISEPPQVESYIGDWILSRNDGVWREREPEFELFELPD